MQDEEKLIKQREYSRKYREKNREKERERQRKAKSLLDRKVVNAYAKEWRNKNKDRINSEKKERLKNDKEYAEKVRSRDRSRPREQIKNNRLKSVYGISLEAFNKKILEQNSKCAICGSAFGDKLKRSLHVDHCHKTNKVRGLLCSNCNLGLGSFRDSIELLEIAISYLRKHFI